MESSVVAVSVIGLINFVVMISARVRDSAFVPSTNLINTLIEIESSIVEVSDNP